MNKYDKQRKAISQAIRDSQRELIKAKENGNQEWIDDCTAKIEGLKNALKTIASLQVLVDLVQS